MHQHSTHATPDQPHRQLPAERYTLYRLDIALFQAKLGSNVPLRLISGLKYSSWAPIESNGLTPGMGPSACYQTIALCMLRRVGTGVARISLPIRDRVRCALLR
jgi:hypothetical protein